MINLRQSRLDIERLHSAAERIAELEVAYRLALDDLRIARTGLNTIAKWAVFLNAQSSYKEFRNIHDRALDTLSLMLTGKD